MTRLDPSMDLRAAFEGHRREGLGPFYLQRFVKHPGRDLGVAVLDGRYIGAYWRGGGVLPRMYPKLSPGRDEKDEPPPPANGPPARPPPPFRPLFPGGRLLPGPARPRPLL